MSIRSFSLNTPLDCVYTHLLSTFFILSYYILAPVLLSMKINKLESTQTTKTVNVLVLSMVCT